MKNTKIVKTKFGEGNKLPHIDKRPYDTDGRHLKQWSDQWHTWLR